MRITLGRHDLFTLSQNNQNGSYLLSAILLFRIFVILYIVQCYFKSANFRKNFLRIIVRHNGLFCNEYNFRCCCLLTSEPETNYFVIYTTESLVGQLFCPFLQKNYDFADNREGSGVCHLILHFVLYKKYRNIADALDHHQSSSSSSSSSSSPATHTKPT